MNTTIIVHHLEFTDFKSYQGKITIGPFADFTCIVGPNGAGKSNIMDGLSFVLAGSVSRGGDPRDLINKTARKRKGGGEASVTMALQIGGKKDVAFTRMVKGDGSVETRIDGHKVRESEFGLGLRKYRIGARVNNFLVFQHEVEAVAHKKSRELTELLEQVSGSGELKAEYNMRKKALDEATEKLTGAAMDKRGAMAEKVQLTAHKKEAAKYVELQSAIATERRDLSLAELYHIETQLAQKKKQYDAQQTTVAEMQKKVATEDDIKRGKQEFAAQHKSYLELVKKNRDQTVKVREQKSSLERFQAGVDFAQRKVERLQNEIEAAKKNANVQSKTMTNLKNQLAQQKALLKQTEDEWAREDAAAQRTSSLSPDQLKEYKALRAAVDVETVTQRQQLETLRRQRDALQVAQRQVQVALDATQSSLADAEGSKERNDAAARGLKAKAEELRQQEHDIAAKLDISRKGLANLQEQDSGRDQQLADLDAQLSELKFVKDDNKHSARVSEALGALQSMFPGRVHGRMVDVVTVPNQKYRNAVTVAMGKFLEAVVVDTTETAMACVRYLKDQRVAQMSFIPLNSAQGNAVSDTLRALGGTCKPAFDLIQFDAIYEPAVRFAVGDTLVCDSVAEAKRIAYGVGGELSADGERHKVVTVDGTVLLKSGAVQGGLAATVARSRKWDEKTYDNLKKAREELLRGAGGVTEADRARVEFEVKDLQSNLDFAKGRIAHAEAEEKKLTTKKRQEIDAQLKALAQQLKDLNTRKTQHDAQIKKLEESMNGVQQQISAVENSKFGDLQRKTGIANLGEWEQREAKQARQRAEQKQKLEINIRRLENSVEDQEKREKDRGTATLEKDFAEAQKKLDGHQKSLGEFTTRVAAAEDAQKKTQAAVDAAKKKLDEIEGQNRRHNKTTDTEVRALAKARKDATMLEAMCDMLREQRRSLFNACRVEQIDLPTCAPGTGGAKGDDAVAAAAAAAGTGRRRARNAEDVPADEPVWNISASEAFSSFNESATADEQSPVGAGGGRKSAGGGNKNKKQPQQNEPHCIDFSSLSAEVRRALVRKEAFAAFKQRADANIEEKTREIDAIDRTSKPNLKVQTRLDVVEEQLKTNTDTIDEMRAKQKKTLEDFSQVKELRFQRFMTMFNKLQEHVDGVYRQLTLGTRAADVHGSAYLTLEDTDEPYNGGTQYHATPPMKRFMTMDALSGGERTMAALALLFSIHCATPTPFFVLDEVDAALDIGNVANLAAYMRERCEQCQFLVVSLKEQLYHRADSLIGVYKDVERETSAILTLDVSKMQQQQQQ